MRITIVILLLVSGVQFYAQNYTTKDTLQVIQLLDSAEKFLTNRPAKSGPILNYALDVSRKIDFKKGIALSLRKLGTLYFKQNKFDKCLESWKEEMTIWQELNNEQNIGDVHSNLGILFSNQSLINEAMDHFDLALEIRLKGGDKKKLRGIYNNIGMAYFYGGNLHLADSMYDIALTYCNSYDSSTYYNVMNNKANLYAQNHQNLKALEIYNDVIAFSIRHKDSERRMGAIINKANILLSEGEIERSIELFKIAYQTSKRLNLVIENGHAAFNLGDAYHQLDKHDSCIYYVTQSMFTFNKMGHLQYLKLCYDLLASSYTANNDTTNLLRVLKKQKVLNDTLQARDHRDQLMQQKLKQHLKQKDQHIENLTTEASFHKTSALIYLGIGLIAITLLVLFFLKYRQNQKLSKDLKLKKEIIEFQNTQLVDSIQYARYLQKSLLTEKKQIASNFKESFIISKPKDIVSGDFFWYHKLKNQHLVAVADCTGHGVPGAFMSVLCHSLLTEVVQEKKLSDPAEILSQLDEKIKAHFKKEGRSISDSVNISICMIHPKAKEIHFAGAMQGMIIVNGQELLEYKGNLKSVGGLEQHGSSSSFQSRIISYTPKDMLILCTDGFQDQMGGPFDRKRRYGKNKFKKILKMAYNKKGIEQGQHLLKSHIVWKGDENQIDDITILGIRLE